MGRNKLIELVDAKNKREDAPQFRTGDTVNVHLRIKEGDKERVQIFNGVVIARKGGGASAPR